MDTVPRKMLSRIADVDVRGPFAPGKVQLHWCEEPRSTTAALEAQIDATWSRELAAARDVGAVLFNGQLIRHIGHRLTGSVLHIDVGPTDYKSFLGTNLRRGESVESIGWSSFANAIGVSALVISRKESSSTRHILLGHRSQKVVDQPGFIHTFGGALDASDRDANGAIDVFAAVTRELSEELSVFADDLVELTCLGLVHDRCIWQPELVFVAHVDMSVSEIERRVDCTSEAAEHDAVELIVDEAEMLGRFIEARGGGGVPVTPVALGALWLHGCQQFGDAWGASVDSRS